MKKFLSLAALLAAPLAAFAQVPQTYQTTGFSDLIAKFALLLKSLFPIAVALAVLALFYSIIMFIIHRSDPAKKDHDIKGILWSVLAIVIMLGFMGFIQIIANTLGVGGAIGESIDANEIPTVSL